MKRKIYLLLLLIFFFFIFDRGAALIFREINYSFNSNVSLKKNAFGKMKIVEKGFFDAMIFGSSRTYAAIHPHYLFQDIQLKAYKEARRGRYPKYFYHFYKNFKNVFGKPKYVLYGIDYFMFKKDSSNLHLKSVLKTKRKSKKIKFEKFVNRKSEIVSRLSLLFRLKEEIDQNVSNLIFKLSLDWDDPNKEGGSASGIGTYVGTKKMLKAKLKFEPPDWEQKAYVNSSHKEGKFLRKLLNQLEKDGVTVVLISLPDFIGTMRTNFQQDLFINDMMQLIRGRKNVHFLNYNTPEKFDLSNLRYFKDGRYGSGNSHLSYWGGLEFNRILAADLARLFNMKLK